MLINYDAKIRRFFEINKEIIKNFYNFTFINKQILIQRVTPYIYRLNTFLSSLTPLSYTLNARGIPSCYLSFLSYPSFVHPQCSEAFRRIPLPPSGRWHISSRDQAGARRGSLAWRLLFLENKKQKRYTGGINPSNVPINQILIYFEWKYIIFLKGCLPYIFSSSKKLI